MDTLRSSGENSDHHMVKRVGRPRMTTLGMWLSQIFVFVTGLLFFVSAPACRLMGTRPEGAFSVKQAQGSGPLTVADLLVLFPFPHNRRAFDALLPLPLSAEAFAQVMKNAFLGVKLHSARYGGTFDQTPAIGLMRSDLDRTTTVRAENTFNLISSADRWKIVALRLHCFRAIPTSKRPCDWQLRLTAQPLVDSAAAGVQGTFDAGASSRFFPLLPKEESTAFREHIEARVDKTLVAEDAAIQLHYELSRDGLKQIVGMLERVRLCKGNDALEADSSAMDAVARRLAHPCAHRLLDTADASLTRTGIAQTTFAELLADHTRVRLAEVLAMNGVIVEYGYAWQFSRYRADSGQNGKAVALIPAVVNSSPALAGEVGPLLSGRESQLGVSLKHYVYAENQHGIPLTIPVQFPGAKDSLVPIHGSYVDLDKVGTQIYAYGSPFPDKREEYKASILKLVDPRVHSDLSVDCVSCHNTTTLSYQLTEQDRADSMTLRVEARRRARADPSAPPLEAPVVDWPEKIATTLVPASNELHPSFVGYYPTHTGANFIQFGYYYLYPAVGIPVLMAAHQDAEELSKQAW